MQQKLFLFLTILFLITTILSVSVVLTAANIVPPSGMSDLLFPVLVEQIKPDECASLELTNLIIGADGTNGNDLILGSSGADNLNGKNGDDCLIGGGGDDTLDGGPGSDTLVGGPGNDSLDGGGGPPRDENICYGGPGANTFNRCDQVH